MTKIVLSILSLVTSFAASAQVEGLSGNYIVKNADCHSLRAGEQVKISVTSTSFEYAVFMQSGSVSGFSPQLSMNLGTVTISGDGSAADGQAVKEEASLSKDGNVFTSTETFMKGPSLNEDEITRTAKVENLGQGIVSLQDNSGADLGGICILQRQ